MSSTNGQSMNYLDAGLPYTSGGSMRSYNSNSSLFPPSYCSGSEQVYNNDAYDYDSSGVSSCSSHDYEDLQSVRAEAKSISGPRKKTNELYESRGNSNPRKKTNDVYEPSRPHRERQITECSDISTTSSALSDALPSKSDSCLSKLILFLILAFSVVSFILVCLLMAGKLGPNRGCSQESNFPAPSTGRSVSVQGLLRRIEALENDLHAMKGKMDARDKAVEIFFTKNENKMEFLQTQVSTQNKIINVTAGKFESLQAQVSTQSQIINETADRMVSVVDGVWVNVTSVDKALEKELVTGLKLFKTSVKSLNQTDGELTSDLNELRQNQILTRGMTKRLVANVTQLDSRVQELNRSSRNISSRAWFLERGYAQMNSLMKRIQAVNSAQNVSHTALQTLLKRLNGSLINVNTTLYNKLKTEDKAGIDFSTCKHNTIDGTPGTVTAGSNGQGAYSDASYSEPPNKHIMGVACSTDSAREYKLLSPRKGKYDCVCKGVSSTTKTIPRTITCFLHVWECAIS